MHISESDCCLIFCEVWVSVGGDWVLLLCNGVGEFRWEVFPPSPPPRILESLFFSGLNLRGEGWSSPEAQGGLNSLSGIFSSSESSFRNSSPPRRRLCASWADILWFSFWPQDVKRSTPTHFLPVVSQKFWDLFVELGISRECVEVGLRDMVSSSKVEYVQTGQLVVANYVKNTKAIGFLWGVFSICYAIIMLLVFFQPQWVGNNSATGPGYFNSWKHCAVSSVSSGGGGTSDSLSSPHCRGRLDDFSTIPNPPLRIATVLIGLSSLVACLSVFALILFICAPTVLAYHIVAWMQTVAGERFINVFELGNPIQE